MKKFLISILFLLVFTLPGQVMSQDSKVTVEQEEGKEILVKVDFEKLKIYEDFDLPSVQNLVELIAQQEANSINTNAEFKQMLLPNTIELVDAIKWQQGINRLNLYATTLNLPLDQYINQEKQRFRQIGYLSLLPPLILGILAFLVIISTKAGWKGQWIIVVFTLLFTLISCYSIIYAIKYLGYTNNEVLKQLIFLSG